MEAIVREHEATIQKLRDEDSRRAVASQGQVALVEARLAATRTEYQARTFGCRFPSHSFPKHLLRHEDDVFPGFYDSSWCSNL